MSAKDTGGAAMDVRAVHRERIHSWGQTATAFRVGIAVGETGIGINEPNPYQSPRGRDSYVEGVKVGIECARMAAMLAARKEAT